MSFSHSSLNALAGGKGHIVERVPPKITRCGVQYHEESYLKSLKYLFSFKIRADS